MISKQTGAERPALDSLDHLIQLAASPQHLLLGHAVLASDAYLGPRVQKQRHATLLDLELLGEGLHRLQLAASHVVDA